MCIYKFDRDDLIKELVEKLDEDVFAKFALFVTSESYYNEEDLVTEFIDNELIAFNDQLELFINAHMTKTFDRKLKELVAQSITSKVA
jgi:DNA-binding MltR family transcriptional regulator